MVTHIVMFTFKQENKAQTINEVKAMLEALIEHVPTLKSMEVGINFTQSERAMDLSLISKFDDRAGLEAYQVHPEHQKVVAFIKEHATLSKVVDYEVL